MKCAIELMTIAAVRAEEVAKEEEIRIAREKARQEELAKQEAARKEREVIERRERTIRYCEQFGADLEKEANKGKTPTITFRCDGRYIGELLKSTWDEYADRRLSYRSCSGSIDFELMAEWFAPYCFEMKFKEFEYWRYWSGLVRGYIVTIEPQPECI